MSSMKGSIQAHSCVSRDKFDSCAIRSMANLNAACRVDHLMVSIAIAADVERAITQPTSCTSTELLSG